MIDFTRMYSSMEEKKHRKNNYIADIIARGGSRRRLYISTPLLLFYAFQHGLTPAVQHFPKSHPPVILITTF